MLQHGSKPNRLRFDDGCLDLNMGSNIGQPAFNSNTAVSSPGPTTSTLTMSPTDLLGVQNQLPPTNMGASTTLNSTPKDLPNVLGSTSKTKATIDSLVREVSDKRVVVCPRCGKSGTDPYMHQNHFSNCKHQVALSGRGDKKPLGHDSPTL